MSKFTNLSAILLIFSLILPLSLNSSYSQLESSEIDENVENPSENSNDCIDYANDKEREPDEYEIGIELTRIGEINKNTGSYEATFWIWLERENIEGPNFIDEYDNAKKDEPNWEIVRFLNANYDKIIFSSKEIHPGYYLAKVDGTFYNEFDFRNFPFETLELDIEVEIDYDYPYGIIYNVVFVEPRVQKDVKATTPGWNIISSSPNVEVHEYGDIESNPNDVYCSFVASYIVEQDHSGLFFKNIFPVILITSFGLLAFWLPKKFMTKIEINAVFLLSVVFFSQFIVENLPPIGYFTIFDKVLMASYSLFILGIVTPSIQLIMENKKATEIRIEKVNRVARYFIPVIGILCLVFILWNA